MKTEAIKRNRFSGDYYNFVTEKVGDQDVTVHSFAKNIKFILGANSGERVKHTDLKCAGFILKCLRTSIGISLTNNLKSWWFIHNLL